MRILTLGLAGLLAASVGVATPGRAATTSDALGSRLISDDVARFWQALDASATEGPAAFQRLYLDPGTAGLQDFVPNRIVSAQHLYDVVTRHREYYESLRRATLDVARYSKAIHASFLALEALYPDARFPDVYFVIGALNSGGTSSDHGLIIGLDMHGRAPGAPMDSLGDWLRTVLKPMDEVPYIVAHELIHFQQRSPDEGDLLSAAIREGSADFLGELISGRHINAVAHEFGAAHEADLWAEFEKRMNGKDLTGWLYSSAPGRPNDLGYYMGYRITESYFDAAPDKRKAVRAILTFSDPGAFLAKSGYAPGKR